MIFGIFSPIAKAKEYSESILLKRIMSYTDCVYHDISTGNFSGGFFLHKSLPYDAKDFYFSGQDENLQVLLSGSVFNLNEWAGVPGSDENVPQPELIARAFLQMGPDFVKKLNGEFAIAIVQNNPKRIFLFRDHVGIRPIAYAISGQSLFFSTDIIGLCRVFNDGKPINRDFLLAQFIYRDYRITPEEQVIKLLPGHWLEFGDKKATLTKYWSPEKIKTDKSLTYETFIAEIENQLIHAVKIRSDKRFTAGAHISGGLDSGIVAALARKEFGNQEKFYALSWSPEDYNPGNVGFDERDLVRKSCKFSDMVPVFSQISTPDFKRFIHQYIFNCGYYFEDMILQQAAELKTNLIFSGWGGDEYISKSRLGIESDLFFALKWRTLLSQHKIMVPKNLLRTLLYEILFPALGILNFSTKKMLKEDAKYLKKQFQKHDMKTVRRFHIYKSRRENHLGYLNFYHLQHRTEFWAVNGFRYGIEYRYPLLDKNIIEYMLKVPSELLCRSDYERTIIREISKGILPEEVRWKKQGTDPVLFEQKDKLIKEVATDCMDEVATWEDNADLSFIDFDILKKDIEKYKRHTTENLPLFGKVITIKAMHEFTKMYREQ